MSGTEEAVREVLTKHGSHFDAAALELAIRIERSWIELGQQTRHCHPESKEDWDAIGAATLAAFIGDAPRKGKRREYLTSGIDYC